MSESPPLYVCSEFERAISNIYFALDHSKYYNETFPMKKRYLFFGQAKLDKERQLQSLMTNEKYPIRELVLDMDQNITLERLTEFNISSTDIIIIRNAHYLVYALKHPTIQKFAHSLKTLNNVIIAISDVPVDENNLFYKQFEEFVVATLPTLEHLEQTFAYYFGQFAKLIEQNSLNITLELTQEDYKWLSQQSTHCHDRDVWEMMQRVYHHAVNGARNDPVVITKDLFEDPNNGFLYAIDRDGVLSITQRDAAKDQNVFTSTSGMGVTPRKRMRE